MTRISKAIPLLAVILLLTIELHGQINQLNIGDQLPDINLQHIRQNDQVFSAKTSDYSGKLLILDFWATWCGPCVRSIPKLDSLQELFKDQIKIIGVSKEPDAVVKTFYQKLYAEKHLKPASVTGDTTLSRLFPYSYVPFFVWVNGNGKIIAITESDQVNEKTIKEAINGNVSSLYNIKIDVDQLPKELSPDLPLFVLSNPFLINDSTFLKAVPPKQIQFQSIFSSYIPNIKGAMNWDSTKFSATNVTLGFFYKFVYAVVTEQKFASIFFAKNRFIMEISNPTIANGISTKTKGQKFNEWIADNGICYELKWNNVKDWKTRYEMLLEDVERYINKPRGIKSVIEQRLVPAYVLKRIPGSNKIKAKDRIEINNYSNHTYNLKGKPLKHMVDFLNYKMYSRDPKPFVDETGITGLVDLQLKGKLNDINVLSAELNKIGIEIIDDERKSDVLVIKDR